MSDNIKLVIEIDKWAYEHIKKYYESQEVVESAYSYIYHGKPLSDVLNEIKAEISRKANSGQWSEATIYGFTKAAAIIDKHIGKAESEDK